MMHPLLSPRLYAQAESRPLQPLRSREPRAIHDFIARTTLRFYRRWGPALGFLLGLAMAFHALAPNAPH